MITYQDDLSNITKKQLMGFFVGWKRPISAEDHFNILKNSQYITLAINQETNKVVGFINVLSDQIQFAFIPMLEVLPNYQNRGIGTELLAQTLAKLNHISNIDLTCDKELQSFYERFNMLKSQGMVIRKYI